MFKNVLKSEIKIGERVYNFISDFDAPTSEVKEVCYQLLKYCGQIEDAIKAQQEKVKAEAEKSNSIQDQPPAEAVVDGNKQ